MPATVPELDKLMDRIMELGCPPMRQFALNNRPGVINRRLEGLEGLGEEQLVVLRSEYARQQKMDEMRCDCLSPPPLSRPPSSPSRVFAKKAE